MRLVYLIDNNIFNIRNDIINIITIENPPLYYSMMQSLLEQAEGFGDKWTAFYGDEQNDFSKCCDVISSISDLTLANKTLQKPLLKYLCSNIEESKLCEEIIEYHSNGVKLIDTLRESCDFLLEYDEELFLPDLLKYYNVRLEPLDGTFVERLIKYISTVRMLTGKDCFIFIGCRGYLCEDDFAYLNKWIKYQGIHIVIFEYIQGGIKCNYNGYTIDNDLCMIY